MQPEIEASFRELMNGLIACELTPEQAGQIGAKLGHAGRVALTDQEVQREGWAAVKQLVGVGGV